MDTNFLIQQKNLKNIRCNKCGKMLAKDNGVAGVEIKCLRCGNLNRILEGMIEQVVITSKDGIILFINRATELATGYTNHEAIGKKPSELWGGHMAKEFYVDMWNNIMTNEQPTKIKMTNKNKSGEIYDVELLISPIYDTNREIIFFVGIEVVV